MWSQTKSLVASGSDQLESHYLINASWGQVFTNQVNENFSFSEGFQQYEGFGRKSSITEDISIQPNPTSGQIQISSSTKIENIKIFDSTGNQVLLGSAENNFTVLDLSHLPAGIYFIHTISANETSNIQKIIKL